MPRVATSVIKAAEGRSATFGLSPQMILDLLGDTLINATMNDPGAMGRLMEKATELNNQKFTLLQIAEEPDLVERRVRTYLQEILYHNLERVNFLYSTALQSRSCR